MEQSAQRLPDPAIGSSDKERRRNVRQKLHSPVYASFNRPETGLVVDLSELLDLHEYGFSVQTGEKLQANRAVTLCLELPETKSYIHGSGQVIWSDDTGRGGVRFSSLPENSRRILKEWLFANLLVGCSNHAARTDQRVRHEQEQHEREQLEQVPLEQAPLGREEDGSPEVSPALASRSLESSRAERIQELADAVFPLEALLREVQDLGDNTDAIFQLITRAALRLTEANGAALAFLTGEKMVCRGRAGEPAPPLGAPVDVTRGLTGECVRTGLLVSCEDMQSDPRVDPEVGRALGIRSLMAAPIMFDFRVVGILEIFSSQPRTFSRTSKTLLLRLIELIPSSCLQVSERAQQFRQVQTEVLVSPQGQIRDARPVTPQPESPQEEISKVAASLPRREISSPPSALQQNSDAVPEPEPSTPARLLYRALIGLVVVVVAMVLGYLLGPALERRWAATSSTQASQHLSSKSSEGASAESGRQVASLTDLQRLANQGDPDAQWQLGVRYHNGEQVPRDDAEAMQWFLRAAEQGHATAEATLGAYYWAGRGVPQDLSKAYFWSAIALAQGDENSKSRLEGLASQMTRAQVSAARQQAETWLRTRNEQAKSVVN